MNINAMSIRWHKVDWLKRIMMMTKMSKNVQTVLII